MTAKALTAYWIQPPSPYGPLGFGVTAWSLADAVDLIRAFDYGVHLPDDLTGVRITEGVTVTQLDHAHVVANMGPIAVRGLWYPFVVVGVPGWAEERIYRHAK